MSAPARRKAPTTRARATEPSRYTNRELSWLEFDARVLQMARDERLPLLERVRFLSISSTNLDEFFMVRVAGLMESRATGRRTPPGELTPSEVLERVSARVADLLREQEEIVVGSLLPALAANGVAILPISRCTEEERAALATTFAAGIYPVLTPLAVDPGRPFPYISGLSLSLGVLVRDPSTGQRRFARVKVPEVLPRFVEVGDGRFVPLEQVIAAHLDALFPGMLIEEHAVFRVTRDADFEIEHATDDLLSAVETELRRRRFGDVVRLEVASDASAAMRETLVQNLEADPAHVYAFTSLVDLGDLSQIANLPRPDLRFGEWDGVAPPRLQPQHGEPPDVFEAIRQGDILVHHPYESFSDSYERFIDQAVEDPDVLAIKHTIYRTGGDSPIVPALIRATEQGKQAVALVELKARFDEQKNIQWARALEHAGVHVVYGFADLKTHAKLALVVRREGTGVRRYAHVGTGNYHPRTARLYTDFGLFTCRPDVTADVADLFNHLTGFARPRRFRRLAVAPFDLRERMLEEIEWVIGAAQSGERARIVMKMNALVDRPAIEALYRASEAGVDIHLVIRGVCCARPGVEGMSERIQVKSLLGRFLEHERAYVFTAGEESHYWFGSADLMPRNLDSRIEALAPVDDPALRARIDEVLEAVLADNRNSWMLKSDGAWERIRMADGAGERSAQEELMRLALDRAGADEEDEVDLDRVIRRPPRAGVDE